MELWEFAAKQRWENTEARPGAMAAMVADEQKLADRNAPRTASYLAHRQAGKTDKESLALVEAEFGFEPGQMGELPVFTQDRGSRQDIAELVEEFGG